MKLYGRICGVLLSGALLVPAGFAVDFPASNTAQTHFDTIIVLGCPARPDGTPSPEMRERVLEGVREYKAGIAPQIIFTGGAAHNQFVEAHVMAMFAASQGVPATAITEEGQAQNTVQNLYYSAQIMKTHSWHSAEVVSSPSHLPRTAILLQTLNQRQPTLAILWRTHAAQWPAEYTDEQKKKLFNGEAQYCITLQTLGIPSSSFLPKP